MALTQIINAGIGQVTDIKLGGSGSANTLSDYEEGTWTPTPDTNSGTAATFGTVQGHYTKIGNLVYVRGYAFNIDTTGTTSTSALRVVGLPFSVDVATSYGTAYTDNFTYQSSRTQINSVFSTSNYLQFTQSGNSASDTTTDHGDVDSATSDIFFSGFYFTNQ
jgi:hypothetical protein